ncbi:MAG: hypothetical protein AAFY17_10735 [Cyanobacteria bacterium J06642_11]
MITLSPAFATWLDGLIEPLIEDRFESASAALMALTQPTVPVSLIQAPTGSAIQLDRRRRHLSLKIPPTGFQKAAARGHVTLAFAWNAIAWFVGLAVLPFFPVAAAIVLFVPFWLVGLGIAWRTVWTVLERVSLTMDPEGYCLKRQLLFWQKMDQGNWSDLERVVLETVMLRNDYPVKTLALRVGIYSHHFGTALSFSEKEWLQQELDTFIQDQKRG